MPEPCPDAAAGEAVGARADSAVLSGRAMASAEGFAAVFYSEPGVLGLLGNVVSAFLLCLQNFTVAATGLGPRAAEQVLAGGCCFSGRSESVV